MKVEDERAAMESQARAAIEANFTKIEQPRPFGIPPVQFEAFGQKAPKMEKFVGVLQDWLTLPYVHDRFAEDSSARREWRREQQAAYAPFGADFFAKIYKDVTKRNKLRAAVSSTPGNFVDNVLFTLERDATPAEQQLHDQIETFWDDDYRKQLEDTTLSIERQIELLKEIEDQLAVVLTMIADYSNGVVAATKEVQEVA